MKRIVCDIDGVLCGNGFPENFATAVPILENIKALNALKEQGAHVTLWTSRRFEDLTVTQAWLDKHGVKYDHIAYDKPPADIYIDDKASRTLPFLLNDKPLNRKKLGICFSGGLDSYIAYHFAKKQGYTDDDILCLNFDIGHPYALKEKMAMQSLDVPYRTMPVGLIDPELQNVPDMKNYIIPARNMIFASILGSLAERVWIVGMKYENHYLMFDKNDSFFNISSIALSQAVGEQTIVESPFINWTKTDEVRWGLENGVSYEQMEKTVSCYHPEKRRCGECSLCFKRWVAFKANGIDEKYDVDPWTSEEAARLIKVYKSAKENRDFSHYQEDRIDETLRIVEGLV